MIYGLEPIIDPEYAKTLDVHKKEVARGIVERVARDMEYALTHKSEKAFSKVENETGWAYDWENSDYGEPRINR